MKKVLIALLAAGLLTACGSEPTTSTEKKEEAPAVEEQAETPAEETEETEEPQEEAKADYEITDLAVDTSDYMPKATGILKNNSGNDVNYLQIEFAVKDADGNKLGTALANINNLKAGDTWKFEAMSFSTDEGQVIDLDDYEVTGF